MKTKLQKAAELVLQRLEAVMHSEYDFPDSDWSPERNGDSDLTKAIKVIRGS